LTARKKWNNFVESDLLKMLRLPAQEIKRGDIFRLHGERHRVSSIDHVKPGRGNLFFRVEAKNVVTGSSAIYKFQSVDFVDKVEIEIMESIYKYTDEDFIVLELVDVMLDGKPAQLQVPAAMCHGSEAELIEGMKVLVEYHDGVPEGLELA
jgi:translation elongation factor P/translation initiation factor 5A